MKYNTAEWTRTFHVIWQTFREKRGDSDWDKFRYRNEMRWDAWRYAGLRGWTVALTPPQRQKGSKRG